MKFRKLICAALAVILMLTSTACSVDLSSTDEESRTVMTVDGFEVPFELYRYWAMINLMNRASAILAKAENGTEEKSGESKKPTEIIAEALEIISEEEKPEIAVEVEKDSLEIITNIYSIFTAAKEEGIDPFGEMIGSLTDMKMEEIRAAYKNDKQYLEDIRQFYMTDNVYSILTRYDIVFDQLYEQYVKNGKIDVSDEAVTEYMNGDGAVRVKQILISFERHSEEEAYALAVDVAETVEGFKNEDGIVDEAKFDELTDKRGEDLFMFKNRDGYYICRGYSDKAFEDAAFALEIGEVSEPVRVSAGYSVMLRAAKDADYIEKNLDNLSEVYVKGVYQTMLDEYSANAKVETNEEFDKIDIYAISK